MIDPHQYSVVIQNDDFPFYATAKVVDALLGCSLPIYAGACNLESYLEQPLPRLSFGRSGSGIAGQGHPAELAL